MVKLFLEYLNKNKFRYGLAARGEQSHVAGREKDGKALLITRFADDPIGSKIACVYNMYTSEFYLVPPGWAELKYPNGYRLTICNDEESCGGWLQNKEGEGNPACSYELASFTSPQTKLGGELTVAELGEEYPVKVLETEDWMLSDEYIRELELLCKHL